MVLIQVFNTIPNFAFVAAAIYTFFYVYIQRRYDQLIERKPEDIFTTEDTTFQYVYAAQLFSALVLCVFVRHMIKPIDTSFAVSTLVITLVVIILEGSVFGFIGPLTN